MAGTSPETTARPYWFDVDSIHTDAGLLTVVADGWLGYANLGT